MGGRARANRHIGAIKLITNMHYHKALPVAAPDFLSSTGRASREVMVMTCGAVGWLLTTHAGMLFVTFHLLHVFKQR